MDVVERDAVRAVVLDVRERVLLFHTRDPTNPAQGVWWELPGGGIDPGETWLEAVVRELDEETGLRVAPASVGAPTWRRRATYRYRDHRRISNEVVVPVRLSVDGPPMDESGRQWYELEDYFDYRWMPIAEVIASTDRFYPGRLPSLLVSFLDGVEIDEPFEEWS